MNRLTHARNNGIKTGYWSPNKKDELIQRLAEYEDTGLDPNEIYALKAKQILSTDESQYQWIPISERCPDPDDYILISFENFTIPCIGRFEIEEDGSGSFYDGDDDEPLSKIGLFANAWMPLPAAYRDDGREGEPHE